ncbi:MAG: AmmeMemoRadiSam system protein B, partial [candidate division Zixibacteria bacterium]|nr:AmmeMemoRadiSam system protein B [candidate division Zixibacteria bacterium]
MKTTDILPPDFRLEFRLRKGSYTMYKTIGILIILLLCLWRPVSSDEIITRQPAVAGTFYPGDSNNLATMVQGHLENVGQPEAIDGQLIALIVPHAGLVYSGQIAAHSYALLRETKFDKLILCGGAHRFGFEGISVYGPKVVWKTPLGSVACDADLCE